MSWKKQKCSAHTRATEGYNMPSNTLHNKNYLISSLHNKKASRCTNCSKLIRQYNTTKLCEKCYRHKKIKEQRSSKNNG